MTEVTLNPAAISQLQSATEYLKLRDADGRLVGYFLPLDPKQREFVFGVKSPLTDEEREARRQETGGRTLAEFWEEMRKKHPDKF
jgi:hypothetical protein